MWRPRKDIKSLGALCSSVRWAVKSSVTWLGSPPGKAAHIGQIWNKRERKRERFLCEIIEVVSNTVTFFKVKFFPEQQTACLTHLLEVWTVQSEIWVAANVALSSSLKLEMRSGLQVWSIYFSLTPHPSASARPHADSTNITWGNLSTSHDSLWREQHIFSHME